MTIVSRKLRGAFAIPLIIGGAAAAERPGAALPPTTKWVLDYQVEECVAGRTFGPADNPTTLLVEPAPNGETYQLTVVQNGRGPELAAVLEGTVDFGFGPITAWPLRMRSSDRKTVRHMFRVTKAEMAQARSAKAVRLHAKGALNANLQLANMPALMNALEKCTADLLKYWNYGGDLDGRIAQQAKGSLVGIFTANDYPSEAQRRMHQGGGQFLLLVDEAGKVAACHVAKSSGIPTFDVKACQVIRERAKLTPARDRNGNPVRSAVISPPIIWRLEG